jgi:hypothetical protein
MKRYLKLALMLIPAILICFIVLLFTVREEVRSYKIQCTLINNNKMTVLLKIDQRKIWFKFPNSPIAHGAFDFKIGGGDERGCMEFTYNKKVIKYCTRGSFSILNLWKNVLYLAIKEKNGFDNFRFLKYNNQNDWEDISEKEFPKEIAIENIDISIGNSYKIDPELENFRSENTAFIWKRLGSNFTSYNTWKQNNSVVEREYLIDFKKNHIDPYWKEEELKNRIPKIISSKEYY